MTITRSRRQVTARRANRPHDWVDRGWPKARLQTTRLTYLSTANRHGPKRMWSVRGLPPSAPGLWTTKMASDQGVLGSGRRDLNPRPQRPERYLGVRRRPPADQKSWSRACGERGRWGAHGGVRGLNAGRLAGPNVKVASLPAKSLTADLERLGGPALRASVGPPTDSRGGRRPGWALVTADSGTASLPGFPVGLVLCIRGYAGDLSA